MDGGLLIIGAVLLLIIGAAWMTLYWRVIDPWLRKLLGRALRVNIYLGEQNIWQINDESVDTLNWRNLFVRPLQIVSLMTMGLLPLVIVIIILVSVFS
ncbi:MAG: hypothetical protein JNJ61_13640 [Anaerolineae bacterium]|nr:hypothetical protein [Anaerolineae bacterium]